MNTTSEGIVMSSADPQGNERLTAMTGAVLLVLFAAECFTTLMMGSLLTLHFFLGMLLLGPVCLKIGSTVWRFTRYYAAAQSPTCAKARQPRCSACSGPFSSSPR